MWFRRENEENLVRTRKKGQCGSDEKIRTMWFGRENEENVVRTKMVVVGLPPPPTIDSLIKIV